MPLWFPWGMLSFLFKSFLNHISLSLSPAFQWILCYGTELLQLSIDCNKEMISKLHFQNLPFSLLLRIRGYSKIPIIFNEIYQQYCLWRFCLTLYFFFSSLILFPTTSPTCNYAMDYISLSTFILKSILYTILTNN